MSKAGLGCLFVLLLECGCAQIPPASPAIAPTPAPQLSPVETPKKTPDFWERLRKGFSLPHDQGVRDAQAYALHSQSLRLTLERGSPFLYAILEAVERRHMPTEIALLPAVESAFHPLARSSKGAAGLWQFMPGTASRYGLPQSVWVDGRLDVMASTEAALDHLAYLHERFGDWLLAIAAYNCGAGAVARALAFNRKHQRPLDIEALPLPRETRRYVPKLLGLARVIEAPHAYGITLPPIPNEPLLQAVEIDGPIALIQVAEMSGLPFETVVSLNPAYRYGIAPPGETHALLLPRERVPRFRAALASLPQEERVRFGKHRIRRGETLIGIARRYRIPVVLLKRFNRLQNHLIRAGDELVIPLRAPEKQPALRYTVQPGDSLWGIARRFKVTVPDLQRQNRLSSVRLRPGQPLMIPGTQAVPPGSAARHPPAGDA
ncbi:MAG: LysM peptidoglycan-binding domain-containing protein [Gammaproteobacteria bacterium]|nr:MAG: LysM peptidoglycan-binding domain-containing protein [Gammaproteobacteria bacterium]